MLIMAMSMTWGSCKACGAIGDCFTTPSTMPRSVGRKTCSLEDVLKVGVCGPLLGGYEVAPSVGGTCCPILGLIGADIELCLCLAVDINVLGLINVHIPKLDIVATILTTCGYTLPPEFICPP